MRMDDEAQITINVIAAELGAKSGKKLSAKDAFLQFVRECRPDITKRVKQIKKAQDENGTKYEEEQ